MVPYASSSAVGVRVVDLNRELNLREVKARINLKQGKVEANGRTYSVPRPNVEARREIATCLLCNNAIKKSGGEWYVRGALKEYNENLERYLRGEIALEDLLKSRARPRILARVRVINDELEFEPATNEDDEKLWKALEKLRRMWGDPDIPVEELWKYTASGGGTLSIWTWGFNTFYKLFNFRQLLTLMKLVKLIRKASKEVEEEFMHANLFERAKEGVVYDSPEARQALTRLTGVITDEVAKLYGVLALDVIKPSTVAEQLLKYSSKTFENVFETLFESLKVLKKLDGSILRQAKIRILEEVVRIKHGESETESIRNGAFKHAKAVTTYLAIALTKHLDYNSIGTSWNAGSWSWNKVQHALAVRGIGMQWNWCEISPLADLPLTYNGTLKNSIKGLSYLVLASSRSPTKVKVLLDDAASLNKLKDEKFDLIVTDPPYRYDVPYTELSDFYYVWLKRALSDVKESFGIMKLAPRFYKQAFFDSSDNEIETQWKVFALREISENEGRMRYFGVGGNALDYFKILLSESFKTMVSKLEDDGLLVTYYAHTSPDAWEALLEAGWLNAKMRVTTAHAIATEFTDSVVARGKIRLDMAIVAVWRKGIKGEALIDEVYAKAVEACSKDAHEYRTAGLEGVNLFVAVLGKALSHFTQYERLIGLKATDKAFVRDLVENYIYPATVEAIARSYGAVGARLSPTSMFYLLSKVLIGRRPRQIRRTLDRTAAIMLSIGTRSDLKDLEDHKVIRRAKEYYVLLEPKWGANDPKDAIGDALTARGLNPRELRMETAVDALHLLEFYAATLPREEFKRRSEEVKGREPRLFDEAVVLARVLASSLPAEDPERELAKQVMEALGLATPGTLEPFLHEVRSDADR
jgi:putative DNA methylase